MAVRVNDALSKVLREMAHSKRFDAWLWFYLENRGAQFDQSYFYGPGMRDLMANYISNTPGMGDEIKHYSGVNLLPEKMFEWISEGERQCQWLVSYLQKGQNCWLRFPPVRLLNRDLVIAIIDTLQVDLSLKKLAVEGMRNAWDQHVKNDGIFLWFKEEDEESKCELASKWLSNNDGIGSVPQVRPIRSHQELLMHFDQFMISHDKRLLCLFAVKKSWSQKKYRNNLSGKKQYNFILSDHAINRLDKLAKKYDLKRVVVLEILLQMESEKNLYIAEKIKIYKGLEDL
ncbi:hypothetical protein EHS17_08360 [Rhodobacteraceae bacterium CH30]|nr:hypothetical protein EHS17_08360 [Rhodobacteraceae bacterium CH30]